MKDSSKGSLSLTEGYADIDSVADLWIWFESFSSSY